MEEDPWDRIWGKYLFDRFKVLLDTASRPDKSYFEMCMSEFEKLYGKADIGIQGWYHQLVAEFMNPERYLDYGSSPMRIIHGRPDKYDRVKG